MRPREKMVPKLDAMSFDLYKKIVVGDLKNQSIKVVINSSVMKYIQDKQKRNDFQNLICSDCDQTNLDKNNLVYKSNLNRVVGQSNSSGFIFKSSIT